MRNQSLESHLESLGFPLDQTGKRDMSFRYVDRYPLSRIDRDASRKNQARLDAPVLEEHVERYFRSLTQFSHKPDASRFPPVVLYERGRKAVLIDGNNRTEAFTRARLSDAEAYVVTCSDVVQLARLIREINNINGVPLDKAQRLQHAYYEMAEFGFNAKQAAASYGLNSKEVERGFRHLQLVHQLPGDIKAEEISTANLDKLSLFREQQPVFEGLARLITGHPLVQQQIDKIFRDVRSEKTERKKLQVIKDWQKNPEVVRQKAAARGTLKLPSRNRRFVVIKAQLARLESELSKCKTISQVGAPTSAEFNALIKMYQDIGFHFGRLSGKRRRGTA